MLPKDSSGNCMLHSKNLLGMTKFNIFLCCITFCFQAITEAQTIPQPFSNSRANTSAPRLFQSPHLQHFLTFEATSAAGQRVSSIFRPDSVSFESSAALGMPFEIDQSQKITYDLQNRPIAMRHYQHHWSGISVLGNTQIFYHPTGHIGGYTFVSTTPTVNTFKFEQNFDDFQRLTSQKNHYTIQGSLQLYEGDSLQYFTQNGQVSEIIDRKYDFQAQQWVRFQRYTNFEFDSTSQQVRAFRMEAWSDSLSSWQSLGDFSSLAWGFGYEGLHEIAQLRIFNGIAQPFNFPRHQATTTPFPSNLVYVLDQGTHVDTLWHYQETVVAGRVMRVDRDVFVNGIRTPYDRILLDYDVHGLLADEKLEQWTGSQWQAQSRHESMRNADLNIVSQRDSSLIQALGSMQLSAAYSYVYDSLPCGQIAQFTRVAEHHVIPFPYARSRFWYDGINTSVDQPDAEQVLAYPNPFTSGFWVDGLTEPSELRCFNVEGKLVFSKKLELGRHWIDGRELQPGLYLFQCIAAGKTSSTRLLKLP